MQYVFDETRLAVREGYTRRLGRHRMKYGELRLGEVPWSWNGRYVATRCEP